MIPAARAFVDRFAGRPVLVVGDAMLDEFVFGDVERISPEAPVPVVRYVRQEIRLGGAANVAHNLRALGARVMLVGLAGDDDAGRRLAGELERQAIPAGGLVVDPARPTTRKVRIVTQRNQQVARIDYEEDGQASAAIEAALVEHVRRAAAEAEAIVVSDYLKGAVTAQVAAEAIAAGRSRGLPVVVDPKVPHIDYYAGARLVTPNHHEAEAVTHIRIRDDAGARAAARAFRARVGCDHVLVTRGERGMTLLEGENDYTLRAAAREVADVTGAGDTVVATIALALAAGASLREAALLANHAA
ncbi:MAG TPA: PfkB family carbohydrate kinase, partial [Vicinamibacterales bacterium]|nr:PfkB family carbohydrate kinase [Vicinamibacterales bacterium]